MRRRVAGPFQFLTRTMLHVHSLVQTFAGIAIGAFSQRVQGFNGTIPRNGHSVTRCIQSLGCGTLGFFCNPLADSGSIVNEFFCIVLDHDQAPFQKVVRICTVYYEVLAQNFKSPCIYSVMARYFSRPKGRISCEFRQIP